MLSDAQIKKYRAQLRAVSLKSLPEGKKQREAERRLIAQWRDLVPDKSIGRQLCESFTDQIGVGALARQETAETKMKKHPIDEQEGR